MSMSKTEKSDIYEKLQSDFLPLKDTLDQLKLNLYQIIKLKFLVLLIFLYRQMSKVFKPKKAYLRSQTELIKYLRNFKGLDISTRGAIRQTEGTYYLSDREVTDFQKSGILGPFRVLEPDEAEHLNEMTWNLFENDFQGNVRFSPKITSVLKATGKFSMVATGQYQALFNQEYHKMISHPKIVQKIASLLGDDIICWKSMLFDKKYGDEATFWHQSGTFREYSHKPKLSPPEGLAPGAVQLTAWVALTNATQENGCMRFLEGSFSDGRLEKIAHIAQDNKFGFLSLFPNDEVERILKTILFTTGSFTKAQQVFDLAVELIPDLFDDFKIRDFEMEAGEAIIFSSMNIHGSYPNTSRDPRLALVGRYTTNDVKVYDGFSHDVYATDKGKLKFNLEKTGCLQVHGSDKYNHNKIVEPVFK